MNELIKLFEIFIICLALFVLIDYLVETYIKNKKK